MQNAICMTCHFREPEYDDLRRIERFLVDRHRYENKRINEIYFDFGSAPKCPYGITCSKVSSARSKFNRESSIVNTLLNQYLTQTDCSDIYELLRLLQGRFPRAYLQVQQEYRKKNSKKEGSEEDP